MNKSLTKQFRHWVRSSVRFEIISLVLSLSVHYFKGTAGRVRVTAACQGCNDTVRVAYRQVEIAEYMCVSK